MAEETKIHLQLLKNLNKNLMTDLISHCFKDKNKKLVTFVTGGDPDFETSKKIIETIINNNIDII